MKRPEFILASLLKANNLTIAFAESMTCGLLSFRLGNIAGASEMLAGSIICYGEAVKTGLLKIRKSQLKKFTAESKEVTESLAVNLKKLISADIHAALTGLASPGGSESPSKPVGTVFYSILFRGKTYSSKHRFYGSPLKVKEKACLQFFEFMVKIIQPLIQNQVSTHQIKIGRKRSPIHHSRSK